MLTNRTQSRVSVSGLTYNNLIEDAYNAIKDSDEFKNTFSTFTSNEAARMIVELYAYVATQLANRMDQMGNELFVDTASPYGLSRLLKLVGAKIDFPSAAHTDVVVSTSATTNPITFTTGIDDGSNELAYVPNAFKSVTANNGTNWEFIEYKVGEDGEYVYDYTTKYTFTAPSESFQIHEGTTHSYDYIIRSVNTDIITLPNNSVIKDSVRIYYKQKVLDAGTTNAYSIREFKKVENFFTTAALTATTGIYTINNMGNGKCEICLKPYEDKNTLTNDIGKELLIMYRTGGGNDGNIAIGSISKTERFNTLGGENDRVTGVGELTINNTVTGAGGKDELAADQIRSVVVNEVRNTKIAITEEDYEYLLPKYDSSIELIKCYGEKNDETVDLAETYGYYANPIAVWFIILKYNKEFYDAYMSGEAGLTDILNDISFNTFDINPRFDEKYQVNLACINQVYKANELNNYYTESLRQYVLPVNAQGVGVLSNGGSRITVTNLPYVDSSIVDKRAEHCFDMYSGSAEAKTWAELLAATSVQEGTVYRITDADPTNTVNSRWRCKQAVPASLPDPYDYSEYWELIDFAYIYDNLVSSGDDADIMYIQQNASSVGEFTVESSYLNNSFSASWEDLVKKYGDSGHTPITLDDISLTINGVTISFNGDQFNSLEDLVDFINARNVPTTYYVSLKDNIAAITAGSNPDEASLTPDSSYVAGSADIVLTFVSDGTAQTVTVDVSRAANYGQLVDAINDGIAENPAIAGKYMAVFNQNAANECWDLWIICKEPFLFKDSSTASTSAIYRYLLAHADYDGSDISSARTEVSIDQVDAWEDFIVNDTSLVGIVNERLAVLFDENGNSSIEIDGTNAGLLREAFGFTSTDDSEHDYNDRRQITVSYVSSTSGNSANVIITMASDSDVLNEDIYINIFGAVNSGIKLGSYYENIEEHLPQGTSQTIINLLKREPIKALYSTSYMSSGEKAKIDKYGCNYQLKFSTEMVEEQTYNELSSGNSPAYVVTTRATYDTLRIFEDEYLYLKVDGNEYSGNGSFVMDNVLYEVPAVNGYAQFDLSWFNSHTVLDFTNALVKAFESEGLDNTPLIDSVIVEGDYMRIYTISTSYYSSLDFGKTTANSIFYLFGENSNIVYSKEGQIDVKQIQYSFLSLTSYPAIGKTMSITYTNKSNTSKSDNIAIGYSNENFATNVAKSEINRNGDVFVTNVVVDNNRLILADLASGAKMRVDLTWDDQSGKNAWKKMFSDASWSKFIITDNYIYKKTEDTEIKTDKTYYTRSGSGTEQDPYVYTEVENPAAADLPNYYENVPASGSAYCEFVNEGDYYVELTSDESGNNIYYLRVENEGSFPFGDIYVHMYEDYSYDHIISEDGSIVTYTDEYNWNNLMKDKRVMLTEHIYKQPRFIPFDLAVTCILPNTETFSQIDYDAELRAFLRDEYGVYSNNIGKEILPDNIILNIKNSFSKILSVTVDYLGYDMLSSITNKAKLETKFNQQHVLASDEISVEAITDPSTGLISFETVTKHGIKLTFRYGK